MRINFTPLSICSLIFLASHISANALDNLSYDDKTRHLNIPSLVIGGVRYNDLVIKVNSVEFVSASSSSKVSVPGATNEICTIDMLTQTKLDAIKEGMSLEQINQIIGCQYGQRVTYGDAADYVWRAGFKSISVSFLLSKDAASPTFGSDTFKYGQAL